MPFRQGSVSYCRTRIDSGKPPAQLDEEGLKQMRKHAIAPDGCGNGATVAAGWITGRHLLDTDFTHETCAFEDAVLASMRVDSVAVPAAIRRAYRAEAEDAARGGSGRTGLSRADRLDAKDQAEHRWMNEVAQGLWRRHAERPVLWDLARGLVLAPVDSDTAFQQFKGLLHETFHCSIARDAAGARAAIEAADLGAGSSLRDAALDAFVAPPASVATDAEGAPRRLTDRPDPAWAAGDPNDFMGNVFLLWLWWHSECHEGVVDADGEEVAIVPERVLDLDCAWGVTGALSLRSDAPTRMSEATRALQAGKMPRRMGFTISAGGEQWRFTLRGETLAVAGLALPRAEEPPKSQREAVEQRVASVLRFDVTLLALYRAFLKQRLSKEWESSKRGIADWIVARGAAVRTGLDRPGVSSTARTQPATVR